MPPMLAAGEATWPYFDGEHPKRSTSIVASWTFRDLEIRLDVYFKDYQQEGKAQSNLFPRSIFVF